MFDLVDKIREQAAENAVAPAICGLEGYVSYLELQERIAVVSNYLADRRVPRLSKVHLNIANPDLHLITTIACLHYGVIPIIVPQPPEAGDIDCDLVIAAPERFPGGQQPDLLIDETVLDGKFADRTLRDFEPRAEDDIMYIFPTSGTTGKHKFIALMYSTYLGMHQRSAYSFPAGTRIMFTIGNQNAAAIFYAFTVLRSKATLVRSHPNAVLYLEMINMFAVSALFTVPKTLEEFMDLMENRSVRCPSVKWINVTGSLFPRKLIDRVERLFDAELWVSYSTSETSPISRGRITSEGFVPGYVGKINPGCRFVVDSRTAGEPGPLVLETDGLLLKPYYDNGKLIRHEGRFYTLPDIGYIKDDNVYLMGRDDEVYNFSGKKLPFSTIEGELRKHAEISDVAIVSDPSRGDPLDLLIAVVSSHPVDAEGVVKDVCTGLSMKSAQSHIRIVQMEAITRNAMGKVDRQAVLKLAQPERSAAPAGSPSLNGGGA